MDRKMKAIPTKYKGIQMRSRLEATWASFFDLLGWKWEYEPCIDFPVNDEGRWVPDFEIQRPNAPGVLVEVKGVPKMEEFYLHEGIERARANAASIGRMLLVVGPQPYEESRLTLIGYLAHPSDHEFGMCYLMQDGDFPFPVWDLFMSYGESEAFGPLFSSLPIVNFLPHGFHCAEGVTYRWTRAKNCTQWRPPK